MGEMKAGSQMVMTVIFSTLFLLVIIVMIWYVVIPWVQFSIIDRCWGQFASDTGWLATGIFMQGYKNVTLDFGECTTGLFFLNKDAMGDLKKITNAAQDTIASYRSEVPITETIFHECDESKEAFMIAVPWFGKPMELGGPMWWIIGGAAVGAWGGGLPGKLPIMGKFLKVFKKIIK